MFVIDMPIVFCEVGNKLYIINDKAASVVYG